MGRLELVTIQHCIVFLNLNNFEMIIGREKAMVKAVAVSEKVEEREVTAKEEKG